jgi:hypothetical protein
METQTQQQTSHKKATQHAITEQSSQLHFSISPYVSLNINAQTPKKPRGIGAEKD